METKHTKEPWSTTAPTPETDARFNQAGMSKSSLADFARRLERERDESRELLREIRDNEVNAQDEADKYLRDGELSELRKCRETLSAPPPAVNKSPFPAIQSLQEVQREGWMPEAPDTMKLIEELETGGDTRRRLLFLANRECILAALKAAEGMAEELYGMACQNACGCGHPACNRCGDAAEARKALAAWKEAAE